MPRENGPGRKLLWFTALWVGGVIAVGTVGLVIKLVLAP